MAWQQLSQRSGPFYVEVPAEDACLGSSALDVSVPVTNIGYSAFADLYSGDMATMLRNACMPGATGYALMLFFRPHLTFYSGCHGNDDRPSLAETLAGFNLEEMVPLPVSWSSVVDPETRTFQGSGESRENAAVVQRLYRFPHIKFQLEFPDYQHIWPMADALDLTATDYPTAWAWHFYPLAPDEYAAFMKAYQDVWDVAENVPTLAMHTCESGEIDPAYAWADQKDFDKWYDLYGKDLENKGWSVLLDNPDPTGEGEVFWDPWKQDMGWDGKERPMTDDAVCEFAYWVYETNFPSMEEYVARVADAFGDGWDDYVGAARETYTAGIARAEQVLEYARSRTEKGGHLWASWWEQRFYPVSLSGSSSDSLDESQPCASSESSPSALAS